jgi:hypothetical protein
MIEAILDDSVESQQAQNNPPFESALDYADEVAKRDVVTEKWRDLPKSDKARFEGDFQNFLVAEGVPDFKSEDMIRAKNLHVLRNEIRAQLREENPFKLLSVEELNFSSALIELLENMENTEHLRELYKLRKRTVGTSKNAGITAEEAQRLKSCLRQGRELFLSGHSGELLVKPLTYFYSLTAYAYVAIILNNPIRVKLDNLPGSHGVNYLHNFVKTQFGGDVTRGTFSELLGSFPTSTLRDRRIVLNQNNEESLLAFYRTRITVATGTLLSMIPEIRQYYNLVSGKPSRSHPLEITSVHDPRTVKWEFQIGDGELRPPLADIQNSFAGFAHAERHGKIIVGVPFTEVHKVRATIYTDIRGRFWYIENPFFPVVLPELCIHFLLTNTFSNIMRYSPDNWGEVLLNQVRSDISLITRKYLSAFENKIPVLLLRSLSKFYPYVSGEN